MSYPPGSRDPKKKKKEKKEKKREKKRKKERGRLHQTHLWFNVWVPQIISPWVLYKKPNSPNHLLHPSKSIHNTIRDQHGFAQNQKTPNPTPQTRKPQSPSPL
jgi:hypothetical protein